MKRLVLLTVLGSVLSIGVGAQLQRPASLIARSAMRHPGLGAGDVSVSPRELAGRRSRRAARRLADLPSATIGYLDPRSEVWTSLVLAAPLLEDAPSASTAAGMPPQQRAWEALLDFVAAHQSALGIDASELSRPRVAIHDGGSRMQIKAQRRVGGLPVRGSSITAVINHGNLVLFGARRWAPIRVARQPSLGSAEARQALQRHVGAPRPTAISAARLEIVPLAVGENLMGGTYDTRLAWVIDSRFDADPGRWEALVDAHSGEILSFTDSNAYATTRRVEGGVYPLSNDGALPGGFEESGYPMPWADVKSAGETRFTDSGGNAPVCVEGNVSSNLQGLYVGIADFCGPVSETAAADLDLGDGAGTDCDVPAGHSPGDTHASRTTYYHLNRIAAMARSHLPTTPWLQDPLVALVNIPDFGFPELFTCNAFWDGSTVNFFASGSPGSGVDCRNTGEIAGVVDHEWGHGLDNNGVDPSLSSPPEGIADVYATLALGESCVARGFFIEGSPCGGSDPCTDCDGVRDVDWANRTSGAPHDVAWVAAMCDPDLQNGPCGGAVHCEGEIVGEAVWDLVHRDLQSPPYSFDFNTAQEVGARLTFLAAGPVGDWFQCQHGEGQHGGCGADGGYLNYLAIDDDNGDLSDGTPHMEAIFAAFDRHGIACNAPTVQDSACAQLPAAAPNVVATALDRAVELSWDAIADAAGYQIFRSEGVAGCDGGKVKVGETAGTTFLDEGLRNGFDVHYIVVPIGSDPSCVGPASACTPTAAAPGANLSLDPASPVVITSGDLDAFVDNCETFEVEARLVNVGAAPLTNARIAAVDIISPPTGVELSTSLPALAAPSLAVCDQASAILQLRADGVTSGEPIVLELELTSDELEAEGHPRRSRIAVLEVEGDVEPRATTTWSFEDDLDAWEVVDGTFTHDASGGAMSSSGSLASSSSLAEQCDGVRSPRLRLSPSSTLTMSTSFDIEPVFFDPKIGTLWSDRANVGIYDVATGNRSAIEPDGGRAYNASGFGGVCETEGQNGWADAMPSWATSTWSPTALGAPTAQGRLVRLDVRYGTDIDIEGTGFAFDEVTITDVDLVVADKQADLCDPGNQQPVAVDDLVKPDLGAGAEIAVLANDFDPDPGDELVILAVGEPAHGTVTVVALGPGLDRLSYTPDPGFDGEDIFPYSVSDGHGGSDIAEVRVDYGVIFSDGFESGDLGAWSDSTEPICEPGGTYLASPSISYECCFGLVSVAIDQFEISADGTVINSAPTNPVPSGLSGEAAMCPSGAIDHSGSLPGKCTETYSLTGGFTGDDTWAGTYAIEFVGPDCACFGLDPCVDQSFPVEAGR